MLRVMISLMMTTRGNTLSSTCPLKSVVRRVALLLLGVSTLQDVATVVDMVSPAVLLVVMPATLVLETFRVLQHNVVV